MSHWAAELIGRPWKPVAYGPDAFFCWGLVHYVFRTRLDIELPMVAVGETLENNYQAIKRVQTDAGWRPCEGEPDQEFDIVLMWGPHGRHVGVMIQMSTGLVLLHAEGYLDDKLRPHGDVRAQRIRDLPRYGYSQIEIWRRA
jgi:cell wall-associated NlpC family hydrolase